MKRGTRPAARVRGEPGSPAPSRVAACAAVIAAAGALAYANSFAGVFLLDDYRHIVTNESIRSLLPLAKHLQDFRPLVHFTLALNYAVGGLQVWSYHALNLAIHVLAGWTLFGIVRRTLGLEDLAPSFESPTLFALAVAVIWVVHPIQTQAVTYLIQRGESMMGLFYLLTLYGALRGTTSARPRAWYALSIACCAAGMLSKEAMVTAPVAVYLLDAVFLGRSWSAPLRARWALYLGLGATWSLLVASGLLRELVRGSTEHVVDIGFQVEALSPWRYLLTQPEVLLHYLRLCFWPSRLCLDYGWELVSSWRQAVIPGSVILALLLITAVAMRRKPGLGALGAWVFLVLAPTSSIVPIQVFAFEHRMYLPLAAIVVLALLGGAAVRDRLLRARPSRAGAIRGASMGLVVLAIAALCGRTVARNADYRSATRMWADVVAQRPRNARAWNAYGVALSVEGRFEESRQAYEHALAVEPDAGEYHGNMGRVLTKLGRPAEAVPHYRIALSTAGKDANLHHSLAVALERSGEPEESIREYRETIRLEPEHPFARFNMGVVLMRASRWEEAERAFSEVVRRSPGDVEARYRRCVCWVQLGRKDEAVGELESILRVAPKHAGAAQLLASLTAGR